MRRSALFEVQARDANMRCTSCATYRHIGDAYPCRPSWSTPLPLLARMGGVAPLEISDEAHDFLGPRIGLLHGADAIEVA